MSVPVPLVAFGRKRVAVTVSVVGGTVAFA